MPSWVARMPRDVGYPAGGSLTSDEWKALLLIYCPVVVSCYYFIRISDTHLEYLEIPMVWEEWIQAAEKEYKTKLKNWKKKMQNYLASANRSDNPPPKPKRRMYPKDDDNFLCLAASMKILLARTINIEELPRAQTLLQDYLDGFHEVRRI